MNKYRQFAINYIKNNKDLGLHDLPISVLENLTEKILGTPVKYIKDKSPTKKLNVG